MRNEIINNKLLTFNKIYVCVNVICDILAVISNFNINIFIVCGKVTVTMLNF